MCWRRFIGSSTYRVSDNYCTSAVVTLLGCEWLITLRSEIDLYWRQKVTAATVLFLANRYLPLVSMISNFSSVHAHSNAVRTFVPVMFWLHPLTIVVEVTM